MDGRGTGWSCAKGYYSYWESLIGRDNDNPLDTQMLNEHLKLILL